MSFQTRSEGLLERWSRRFDWAARAKAHAAHRAMVEREASEALVRGVAAEWLRRQQALRETEWQMHEQCIAAAKRGARQRGQPRASPGPAVVLAGCSNPRPAASP